MSSTYRIAVVGATGAVGETVLRVLAERETLPIGDVVPFASPRSVGKEVAFGDGALECRALDEQATRGFDLVFCAAGGSVSNEWAPRFAENGAVVIDKTSNWRMEPDVPLVVPEVNPDEVHNATRNIISSPNCSTMQLVVALNVIRQEADLAEIVVSTYQSVSGTGGAAIDELKHQIEDYFDEKDSQPRVFPHKIAFNVLPQVESFDHSEEGYEGYSTEEIKMMRETRKIFGFETDDNDALPISASCARVPVINCHSESVLIETKRPMSADECRQVLARTPGVALLDSPADGLYPMAIHAEGHDEVFVGRVREVPGKSNRLNLWVVGDNLRKGAATNAVQIAELLHARDLLSNSTSRTAVYA